MSAASCPAPVGSSRPSHDRSSREKGRPFFRLALIGLPVTLALVATAGSTFVGCSKGGAPDANSACRKLTDPEPGQPDPRKPPVGLYAELRSPSTGTMIPIQLDGTGGAYSGTHTFGKCDEAGPYYVERITLVDVIGGPVAVATRSGSAYTIAYQGGQNAVASGTGFSNLMVNFTSPATQVNLNLQSVTATPQMLKVGEKFSFSVSMGTDDCAIKESRWWLSSTMIGAMTSAVVSLPGGSGTGSLRIPATNTAGTYFLEGSISLTSGREIRVQRTSLGDTTYKLIDTRTMMPVATTVPVIGLAVADNPDADRTAPQSLGMQAAPASVAPCSQVNLTLKLSDDRALPSSQTAQVWLGPISNPKLTKATLMGGGDSLFGTFIVPQDAPSGVWYAFPMTIQDAAGNIGSGEWKGDGKFVVTGEKVTPQPVPAATFIVESPLLTALPDLAQLPPSDMAGPPPDLMPAQLPANLTSVTASPASITMDGQMVTVTVTWTDNAKILK